jgi:hypothetical protein
LGGFIGAALNLATSGKFGDRANAILEILLKVVKNAAIPIMLANVLHFGLGLGLGANSSLDLFAKIGSSNLVAKLITRIATSSAIQVAMMASVGTLINAASGLVDTAAKYGMYAYLAVKILVIQTFPMALIGFSMAAGHYRLLSGQKTIFTFMAGIFLLGASKFAGDTICNYPLRAIQAALTIVEIPFRFGFLLLHAASCRDALEIAKTELWSIPYNKLRILQKPQIQFQGFDDANLSETEMDDVRIALAIAGESRGRYEGNPSELRRELLKRDLVLIDSLDVPNEITDAGIREHMASFLSTISVGNPPKFSFENGAIKTDSGMQGTLAYDRKAKIMRVFYHGTDFELTSRGIKTIAADVQIVASTNAAKEMADDATMLLSIASGEFGTDHCRAIGHSLGGGLCQVACARTGVVGVSINPAPVNEDYLARLETDALKFAQEKCIQISLKGDVLSNALLTRNGGCVQLFGRKINIPYGGFGNEHRANIALEALGQVENQNRNKAMTNAQENTGKIRTLIAKHEEQIGRIRNNLASLESDTSGQGKAQNARKKKLQQEIGTFEQEIARLRLEEEALANKARKAAEETQRIVDETYAAIKSHNDR